jgi:choline dehydrogenase-like flavoprotein
MTDDRQVVVIGSGPSGATAAQVLVQQGIPVTLLESGAEFPGGVLVRIAGRTVFRRTSNLGVVNGKLHVATGDPETQWWCSLSPGGFSNEWTGAVPRFAPEDFCEGGRLDERYVWPLTYDELAPYYDRVEPLLVVTAAAGAVPNLPATNAAYRQRLPSDWQRVAEVAARNGQGMVMTPLADGPPWLFARRGTAFNSYTNIVLPLLRSPHFKLITGAHVLQLEYSPARRKVAGVIYHDHKDGARKRIAAAAVVVAAGPLYSAKLLFDSACPDFSEGLGNAEGVLGRYIHDHPRDWWTFELDRPISRLAPSAYLTRRPHQESAPLYATSWTIGLLPSRKEKLLSFLPLKTNAFGVQVFGTMIPTEEYYIRPHPEKKDEHGTAIMEIYIRYEDEVIQNVVAARDHLMALLAEAGYPGRLRDTPTKMRPGNSVHYGGAVRMHHSPKFGMTDAWNRLHAVPNVVVVDASCFTTGVEKNPTPTAMALAARAAERLADDLKKMG